MRKKMVMASCRSRQRGGIAIIVGLTLAVLVGFAGLALDGGRLYVNKTETQNAADACALAAASELTGAPAIPTANFPRAESAGRTVAQRNRVGFQTNAVVNANVQVQFSTQLSGGWVGAGAATPDARYVRCTIAEPGITPWFMQVLGFGAQTVQSLATASLVPSQAVCSGIPMAMCSQGGAPSFGLVPGNWYNGGFENAGQLTGSFAWIDYTPPSGGASELAAVLAGPGQCLSSVGTSVGATGAIASLNRQWNTRFGIYHPSISPSGAGSPDPDQSGYAYRAANWPSQRNAAADFINVRRPANQPYGSPGVQEGNTLTGLSVSPNGSTVLQASTLATRASLISRRIVSAPIVNCAAFVTSQTVPILDYACVLMLHPLDNTPGLTVFMEYIGLSSAPGSPCGGGLGIPGGTTSTGPLVPGLVQ